MQSNWQVVALRLHFNLFRMEVHLIAVGSTELRIYKVKLNAEQRATKTHVKTIGFCTLVLFSVHLTHGS